jgi:tRNA(fMet)-specific endonuclease VapC
VIYLLDTNAWIAYLRRSSAALIQKMQQANPSDIRLCSAALAELYYGAYHSPAAFQAHNLGLLAALRRQFISLSFDDPAAEDADKIRADLAAKGTPIGPNDLLIAALARANALTLVTHNTMEFSRVPGLTLENWQV